MALEFLDTSGSGDPSVVLWQNTRKERGKPDSGQPTHTLTTPTAELSNRMGAVPFPLCASSKCAVPTVENPHILPMEEPESTRQRAGTANRHAQGCLWRKAGWISPISVQRVNRADQVTNARALIPPRQEWPETVPNSGHRFNVVCVYP